MPYAHLDDLEPVNNFAARKAFQERVSVEQQGLAADPDEQAKISAWIKSRFGSETEAAAMPVVFDDLAAIPAAVNTEGGT